MKFHTSISAFLMTISTCLAERIAFDPGYDNANRPLTDVACSDGDNGVISKYKYATQGNIPSFPNIGASDTIKMWNSPNVS